MLVISICPKSKKSCSSLDGKVIINICQRFFGLFTWDVILFWRNVLSITFLDYLFILFFINFVAVSCEVTTQYRVNGRVDYITLSINEIDEGTWHTLFAR